MHRSREAAGVAHGVRVDNFNHALVPFVIALLVCGLNSLLTAALIRQNPNALKSSLPWVGVLLLFAGFAFWQGTRRVLWLRIDQSIWLVRLFAVKQYAIADLKRLGFLWGRTDLRHTPPPSAATFLIEFADGKEFERVVAPHVAARIAAAMNRLAPRGTAVLTGDSNRPLHSTGGRCVDGYRHQAGFLHPKGHFLSKQAAPATDLRGFPPAITI
jgi:hypothetical protein